MICYNYKSYYIFIICMCIYIYIMYIFFIMSWIIYTTISDTTYCNITCESVNILCVYIYHEYVLYHVTYHTVIGSNLDKISCMYVYVYTHTCMPEKSPRLLPCLPDAHPVCMYIECNISCHIQRFKIYDIVDFGPLWLCSQVAAGPLCAACREPSGWRRSAARAPGMARPCLLAQPQ